MLAAIAANAFGRPDERISLRHPFSDYDVIMGDVIRPTFGGGQRSNPAPDDAPAPYVPLRAVGSAGGYAVGLIRADAASEGAVVKVVLSALGWGEVEPVAIFPATPRGETDAEAAAFAILRTLELIAGRGGLPDIA